MGKQRVLLGVNWSDGTPSVRIRDDEPASELVPLVGFGLTFQATPSDQKVCIGHKPFRSGGPSYVDCHQAPQPGGSTCRACAIVEATFASNLHHAHTKETVGVDPDIAAHLRQPNLLYLAAFRDGSIKVGTSTEHRIQTRLAEQGAWTALIVARAVNGVAVRVLEDAVTATLGLPQSVSASRKLAGLITPVDDQKVLDALSEHRKAIHRMLQQPLLSAVAPDQYTALHDHWQFAGSADNRWANVHPYPVNLNTGAHDLDVVTACGRLAMVRKTDGTDNFVVDLRTLFGHVVEWGHFGSEPLAVQDRLF